MRKNLSVLVGAALLALSLPVAASAAATWNLAKDFRVCPSYSNPNPDSTGKMTWYFLQNYTKAHTPSTYTLLPSFLPDAYNQNGLSGWHGDNWDGYYHIAGPEVLINATCADYYDWPAGKVMLANTGAAERLTIVGWKSPISGTVRVNATFTTDAASANGDGMQWFVDKGASTLATGTLIGAQTGVFDQNVSVNKNQYLYFIFDGFNIFYYDGAYLDLTITQL